MNSNVTISAKHLEENKIREVTGLGQGSQGRPLGGEGICAETPMRRRPCSGAPGGRH